MDTRIHQILQVCTEVLENESQYSEDAVDLAYTIKNLLHQR